jgi:hypothetical protein
MPAGRTARLHWPAALPGCTVRLDGPGQPGVLATTHIEKYCEPPP